MKAERTAREKCDCTSYFYENQYVIMAVSLDAEPFSKYIVQRLALNLREC